MNFSRFRNSFTSRDKQSGPSPLRTSVSSDDRSERSRDSQPTTPNASSRARKSSARPQSWMPPPGAAAAQRSRKSSTSTITSIHRPLNVGRPSGGAPPLPRAPEARSFSQYSSPALPDSMFNACDLLLGSGMVILQPGTNKVVLIYERERKYWFLPKGRKDLGETLEQAALREAYEESGYHAEFLPLAIPTNAEPPPPPESPGEQTPRPPLVNTEPFYMSTHAWWKRPQSPDGVPHRGDGVEYLTFWYIGYIADDAVPDADTGMPDEENYRSYLLTYEEAMGKLEGNQFARTLVDMAFHVLRTTREKYEERQRAALPRMPLGLSAAEVPNGANGATNGVGGESSLSTGLPSTSSAPTSVPLASPPLTRPPSKPSKRGADDSPPLPPKDRSMNPPRPNGLTTRTSSSNSSGASSSRRPNGVNGHKIR